MALNGSFRNDYRRDIKLEYKIDEFSGFLRDLSRTLKTSATMQQITDYEVSRIMEKAVQFTGKADIAKMRSKIGGLRIIDLEGKKQPLYNKKTGRPQRFRNDVWAKIQAKRALMLSLLLQARGLSAQSWYRLARLIGFEVKAPAYVKSALPYKRRAVGSVNANVSIIRSGIGSGKYGLEITNRMPKLQFHPKPAGLNALFSAISGRIGFFKRNLSKGVFKDAAATAAKYRGISVTTDI